MTAPFATLLWNDELIRRYDLSGPRYTSYPTALQFADATEQDSLRAIDESDRSGVPLSLYFHIPFCARLCYYCACNKIVTKRRERAQPYLDRLFREMDLLSQHHQHTARAVEQLHWGGGTPTFLSEEQMSELMAKTASIYPFADASVRDFSIEIDPREVRDTTLTTLRKIGFNRISFGVQDFDAKVQKAVNRIQPYEMTKAVVDEARQQGFRSLNIDLIYGLPFQTPASFERTLEQVLTLQPDRLSVFNYAHLPHRFDPQRRIKEEDLPSAPDKLLMFQNTITTLLGNDYAYIGMDHFAKHSDSLAIAQRDGHLHRNFQGYTTHRDCDLIGFGVSSISQIGSAYLQNHHDQTLYEAAVDAGKLPVKRGLWLNDDDKCRRDLIMRLICHFTLDMAEFERDYTISFDDYFANEMTRLRQYEADKLIAIENRRMVVLPPGRLLIRAICQVFDRYQSSAPQKSFSRII